MSAVGGGCVNNGARLHTDRGSRFFLKWNASAPPGLFSEEAAGLTALDRAARGAGKVAPGSHDRSGPTVTVDGGQGSGPNIRIPAVLAYEDSARHEENAAPGWLLLDYVEPAPPGPDHDVLLGRGLAEIHGSGETAGPPGAGRFGWVSDNWIGTLVQRNTPCDDWGVFWRDQRLAPQLTRARSRGFLTSEVMDQVLDRTADALADVSDAALLHGDLWSGNAFASRDGRPVLIDPAVHMGDGEVDLAMTELFGGFGPTFQAAYGEHRPVSLSYSAYRRDLYQLYYLLVHVNLFGAGYEAATLGAARRVMAELG